MPPVKKVSFELSIAYIFSIPYNSALQHLLVHQCELRCSILDFDESQALIHRKYKSHKSSCLSRFRNNYEFPSTTTITTNPISPLSQTNIPQNTPFSSSALTTLAKLLSTPKSNHYIPRTTPLPPNPHS